MIRALLLSLPLLFASPALADDLEDPHLWLEDVTGEEALDWVRQQNEVSVAALASDDEFESLEQRLLAAFDSDERIPYVTRRNDHYYNFWRDGEHARGVWRRTSLEEYRKPEPAWDVVLDLDALAAAEDENWVWHGATCLPPAYERCLVSLSRGGADASVTREFDVPSRQFVEDGFVLEEAKGGASWIDPDTVFVATDFGEGSLTDAGYPRIAKRWQRGTPLEQAEPVIEGETQDVSVGAYHDHTPGFERHVAYRSINFYATEIHLLKRGSLVQVVKPEDAKATIHREWLLLELRSDWTHDGVSYVAGSLLVTELRKWMKGRGRLELLFEPDERSSLAGLSTTRNHVMLNILDNVRNRIEVLTPGKKGWERQPLPGLPEYGTVSAWGEDDHHSDAYFLNISDYVTPTTLSRGEIGADGEVLKQLPAFFDATGLVISQHEATSADGTRIPYFQVAAEDLAADGQAPVLLSGYGGFEIPLLPSYRASVGIGWLERGGVYAVANIRGGGEFGPRWHQAALKEKRPRAYEDFIAVGEDLIRRGITSTEHLGISGGSNGGLLVGNMYVMRPDLWGAVLCRVPLLDMRRYHTLLAGASWMAEYGDPDEPEQWAFIKGFSPYHLVDPHADYPPMLITTSTRDDRVHPGHARKMSARLLEHDKDLLYYENIEGGHGGAANNAQAAFMSAMGYAFLWRELTAAPEADEPAEEAE